MPAVKSFSRACDMNKRVVWRTLASESLSQSCLVATLFRGVWAAEDWSKLVVAHIYLDHIVIETLKEHVPKTDLHLQQRIQDLWRQGCELPSALLAMHLDPLRRRRPTQYSGRKSRNRSWLMSTLVLPFDSNISIWVGGFALPCKASDLHQIRTFFVQIPPIGKPTIAQDSVACGNEERAAGGDLPWGLCRLPALTLLMLRKLDVSAFYGECDCMRPVVRPKLCKYALHMAFDGLFADGEIVGYPLVRVAGRD